RERLGGAQPDEAVFALVDVRPENVRMPAASAAINTVGGDDQVGVRTCLVVLVFVLEALLHSQLTGALLQDLQQLFAADAAEPVATADQLAAAKMDGNIVPVMEIPQDRAMCLGIGGAEVPHGLVGE